MMREHLLKKGGKNHAGNADDHACGVLFLLVVRYGEKRLSAKAAAAEAAAKLEMNRSTFYRKARELDHESTDDRTGEETQES